MRDPKDPSGKNPTQAHATSPGPCEYGRDVSINGPSPLMLTVQEFAKRTNVSDDYIYGLVHRREIPFVRFGSNIRFHAADVRAFVNRLRAASLDEAERHAGKR